MNALASAKAHAAVIAAACMWGSIGLFVRTLDKYGYSPLSIVFVRMIVAFVILCACLCLFNKKNLLRIKIKDVWIFIGTGLSSAILLNLFYSLSIVANTLSLASVLLATSPFFVVFLSAPLFKEKITAVKITALLIAFSGCVLTSGFIGSGAEFNPFGIFIGVLSGIGWAVYSIFSRFALNRGYDSLTVNVYSFAIGSLACLPFTDFAVIGASVGTNPAFMLFLLLLHALIGSLLPYILYTYGLQYIETGKAAIMSGIDPVTAVLLGAAIYAEIPSFICVLGIALVLLAIALLNLPRNSRSSPKQ
ncbi:MAG: DMT family transporter [Gracilibacteraceae bacterium]|nr:DMT family transporter [Gracilibacteraceae bacterium]